jgi:hypothetical protein
MASSDQDPKPQPSEREQKLAQALRANLRRRKAGGPATAPKAGDAKSGDESADET